MHMQLDYLPNLCSACVLFWPKGMHTSTSRRQTQGSGLHIHWNSMVLKRQSMDCNESMGLVWIFPLLPFQLSHP